MQTTQLLFLAGYVILSACGTVCAETSITVNGNTIREPGATITVIDGIRIVNGNIFRQSTVEGSGKIVTEFRTPGEFDRLQLDIPANVTVVSGKTAVCSVTTDTNIAPLLITESRKGTLHIYARESFATGHRVKIILRVPQLAYAAVNGAGHITLADVKQGMLELLVNGSGKINARGRTDRLAIIVNGSGAVHAADLDAETVSVTINGSGKAAVNAATTLRAEVNGSGAVRYSGKPSSAHAAISGSGDVVAAN